MTRQFFFAVLVCCAAGAIGFEDALAQEYDDLREALEAIESLQDSEMMQDPAEIFAWVTVPEEVKKGDTAELVLTVKNGRAEEDFDMSSVDIYDEFLDGFEVLSLDPAPRHDDHSLGMWELQYPITLAPGETWELRLRLRAKETGAFIGDVDVYEGFQFLTRKAQTAIR